MSAPKNNLKKIALTLLFVVVLNFAGHFAFKRFDLTADKRYTLSETSLTIVSEVQEPLYIDVFLEGEFPGEFKKLQTETQQLLEEFKAENPNIIFQFVNPLEDEEKRDATIQSFLDRGLTPVNVTVNDKGQQTQEVVFPWAVATCGDRVIKVPLLKNMMGASTAEKVVSSVQHLEYAFANAINTVAKAKQKKVVILNGNGELEDRYIANFITAVRDNYFIGPFTLDSVAKSPNETLKYLNKYDLAVIAKPTEAFTDKEKQVLDQYIINGGKTLWLVDQVNMEMDSLYNQTGSNLAFPRDLGLNDMFFKYGVRIRPDLIFDLQNTPIALATGEQGSATQYTQYPWFYSPLIYPSVKHPMVSNLDGIKFDFASPIEVLGKGNYPVAVLLEGQFHSMYENRVLPFKDATFKNLGKANKMIVVSDGDIIKNQLDKDGQPLELGYDKWTNNLYANKEFMMNCVNYLLDDNGLINIRSKEVDLPLLDKQKVYDNYTYSQVVTVAVPIVILLLFGVAFTLLRKRKYSK
jgi:gliding-associated putative ABC transporter substrate-binding component GldG